MKMNSKYAGLAAAVAALVCAGVGHANTLSAVIGGSAQSGENYVNFDSLSGGSTATYTSGALTVSFAGNAQTESSTINNASSAPYLSGNNNLYFEATTPVGADTTTYLGAGNNGGGGVLTFNFSSAQNYFGLLWGSIDFGSGNANVLTFWSGANGTGSVVDTVTGDNLIALNPFLDDGLPPSTNSVSGSQDSTGTAYVNIGTTLSFESVVATSGHFTFEMDNIAYGNSSVPDTTSSFGLLLAGLGGLVLFGAKWSRRSARASN